MSKADLPWYEQARLQQATYRVIKARVDAVLDKFALNTTQWVILSLIKSKPGQLRIKDVAGQLQVKATLVTKLVNQLERADLLEVAVHQQDSRARALAPTAAGSRLLGRIAPALTEQLRPLQAGISPADRQTYLAVLAQYLANAEADQQN